jgi:hypothetical protein
VAFVMGELAAEEQIFGLDFVYLKQRFRGGIDASEVGQGCLKGEHIL